jgi:hypothetical protein
MRAAIACLWLLGCGRIAFDPRNDSGSSSIDDSTDAPGLACTPFDIAVPTDQIHSHPGIVSTPQGWFVHFSRSSSGIGLLPVGFDGTVGTPRPIEPIGASKEAIAWDGARIAVVSVASQKVSLFFHDPVNDSSSPAITVNPASQAGVARIAWAGDRYVVGWAFGGNVYLRELDAGGTPLTQELLVSTTGGNVTAIAISASHYVTCGIVSASNPFAVSVNRTSFLLQTMALDLGAGALCDAVARTDGTFAAIFGDASSGKLQRLDATGTPSGAGQLLPFHTGANFYQRLAIRPGGYRMIAFPTSGVHTIERYDLDDTLTIVGGPTTIGSFSAGTVYYSTMVAAGDRTLFAAGYNDGAEWLKLVQTCP